MLLLNGRSISPAAGNSSRWKLPYIEKTLINDNSSAPVFILAVTETWFTDTISDAQTEINNYQCFRSDRKGRRGGGCALYLHGKSIPSDQDTFSDQHNNMVAVYIESLHSIICVIYRPPDAPDESFKTLLDQLQDMISNHSNGERYPELYILGDFNLPLFNWNECSIPTSPPNAAYKRLLDLIDVNFLTQMVCHPTRGDNILDLVMTNRSQNIIEIQSEDNTISDHMIVKCTLGFNPISSRKIDNLPEPWTFRAINYHKGDLVALDNDLGSVNWHKLKALCDDEGDPDNSIFKELLIQTVLQLSMKHCPPKIKPNGAPKGKTEKELISLKMKRRKINRKIASLKSSTNPVPDKIKKLEFQVNSIAYDIRDVIISQLNEKESRAVETIKTNPKYFYSYAKRLAKCKSIVAPLKDAHGDLNDDPKTKAEILQTQYVSVFSDPDKADIEECLRSVRPIEDAELSNIDFNISDIVEAISELDPYSATPDGDIPARILCSCKNTLAVPLWLLWKSSFDSGKIPPDLKMQYITPLFKKGNKTEAVNYRPVSITSHLIKIFERVMRKHLVQHLEENQAIPDSQHGFRRSRSCLTQLIEHVDTVLRSLNEGNEVDVIYLDYSKAFDKVDHKLLLEKLKLYGITGKAYRWLESFLTGRQQTVVVDGAKSSFHAVSSGVPQGTVLGPILFILYVIEMVLKVRNSKPLTFADDSKLTQVIVDLFCKALLQADLTSVTQWSIANNMLLHQDKFVVMNYCLNTSKFLRELPFTAETRQYYTTKGEIMDASHSTRDLGVYLADDCTWTLHINKTASDARHIASWILGAFRDRSVLTMITLYKSLVRSKVEYCSPLWNPSKITDIQTLENIQKQFTKKILGFKDIDYWTRLKKLKLLSLQRRRERYTIIHVWKIVNDKAPNGIDMKFYTSERLGVRAIVPSFNNTAQRSVSTAYDNSFGVKAARLWNILPKDVNTQSTLDGFKIVLGAFIQRFPDMPPATGYTPPNSNSLLDWSTDRRDGGHGVCA